MEIFGTVSDILRGKGAEVWTTTPDVWVFDAVRTMGEKNVGALVVVEDGVVAGVVSERDYTRKVVLRGRTSRDTKVGDILTRPAVTVQPSERIDECMRLMTERRIRHLPVVEEGKLVGLVSMGDLVNWIIHVQRETIQHLQSYITGSYPG
jgi:CBS domain-containing protein